MAKRKRSEFDEWLAIQKASPSLKRTSRPKLTNEQWDKLEARAKRPWGRVQTAERSDYFHSPVNRTALRQMKRSGEKHPYASKEEKHNARIQQRAGRLVYLVRFRTRDGAVDFLKIGITKNSIEERFNLDSTRFEIMPVGASIWLNHKDARLLESTFHLYFRAHKCRPELPLLSGGNSECFSWSQELSDKMKGFVESFAKNEWLLRASDRMAKAKRPWSYVVEQDAGIVQW